MVTILKTTPCKSILKLTTVPTIPIRSIVEFWRVPTTGWAPTAAPSIVRTTWRRTVGSTTAVGWRTTATASSVGRRGTIGWRRRTVPATVSTIVVSSVFETVVIAAATIVVVAAALVSRNVFDRDNGLIHLAPVGVILGPGRLVDCLELHKGVVFLHVDSHQFSIGLKEHFQILLPCLFGVKIDHKECLIGENRFAAFVFLALDASIPTRKFGADRVTDVWNVPVVLCWWQRSKRRNKCQLPLNRQAKALVCKRSFFTKARGYTSRVYTQTHNERDIIRHGPSRAVAYCTPFTYIPLIFLTKS